MYSKGSAQMNHWVSRQFVLLILATFLLLVPGGARAQQSTGDTPPATAEKHPANPKLPTLFVVGDSTANNNTNGGRGWGDPFIGFFDDSKVNVLNRARGGRSSRTFFSGGLWDKVLQDLKPGDIVLIQFGHNDGGPINDASRARGSLPGTGEETQEIDNLLTKKHEVVHTFGWYVRKFIADTKAKGATPIVLSLTVRNIWKDGKVERGPGRYGQWSAEIAQAQSVGFLDLTTIVADKYETLGEEKVKPLFGPDHTHTSLAGAELNAAAVVSGLKGFNPCAVCDYFSESGKAIGALPKNVVANTRVRRPLPEPANPKLPTLFLIGDSTVRNGHGDGGGGQWGWGEPLVAFFDAGKINVVNRAVGGLSSRTYLTGGHWDKVLAMLKPGDFVIMQFGHNDSGPLNDDSRARGTIKGIGDETQEIDNLLTKKHEVVHSYGWYLRKFIADAKAKGATPIVCSLVPRKIWKDGKIVRSQDYAKWAEQVARAESVALVDLNEIIARQYDALGAEKVEPLFGDEHTHTSLAGAELNAASVVSGLKLVKHCPLCKYFSERGKVVLAQNRER
jgi:lysophospholipase L1-like esterase